MNLMILAHPKFDQSIANKTIVEALKESGVPLDIRNIHELYPDYQIDIKAEQENLLKYQNIILQYPFYWYSMPAILKHWIDEVFEYGFAYGNEGDKLKGKNLIPSFTVGSSKESYSALGFQHFRIYEYCKQLEQIAYYTQMHYIEPIYSYETSLAAGYSKKSIIKVAYQHAERIIHQLQLVDEMHSQEK